MHISGELEILDAELIYDTGETWFDYETYYIDLFVDIKTPNGLSGHVKWFSSKHFNDKAGLFFSDYTIHGIKKNKNGKWQKNRY